MLDFIGFNITCKEENCRFKQVQNDIKGRIRFKCQNKGCNKEHILGKEGKEEIKDFQINKIKQKLKLKF